MVKLHPECRGRVLSLHEIVSDNVTPECLRESKENLKDIFQVFNVGEKFPHE